MKMKISIWENRLFSAHYAINTIDATQQAQQSLKNIIHGCIRT